MVAYRWDLGRDLTIAHIVLLTGETEASVLADVLRRHNPELEVTVAPDKRALSKISAAALSSARLISFCSSVIVPEEVLLALPGPSYNFHPGPPDRPGRFPAVFALYENAARFGVTVHEMAAAVDAGPIVAAEWFAVPDDADLATLESAALVELMTVFHRLAPFLALNPRPLPRILVPWSGTKRSKADCEAICTLRADMPDDEQARRRRSCGTLLLP